MAKSESTLARCAGASPVKVNIRSDVLGVVFRLLEAVPQACSRDLA